MQHLHIYRKVGKTWSWQADGEGNLEPTAEFRVTISKGSVSQGQTYEIRQGTSMDGDLYDCKAGAQKGQDARFKKAAANDELQLARAANTQAIHEFRAALLAAQKTVSINIDLEDLQTLKASNYRLCFAKKVGNEDYNVVWQSYQQYLAYNEFSWTPVYQLFGSNTFVDNMTVKVSTNSVDIGLGETSTLNSAGVLSPASTGGTSTAITMVNKYGLIHPGVNQLSTGIDGQQVSTPIYVAENPIVLGNAELTPVETVLVWFEQNIETSTMFSTARSMSVEIDLTTTNAQTRLYQGGRWSTP